ncbi:GDP-mannose 4,6-dehydratase [Candidatus Auribacterota bacterium]
MGRYLVTGGAGFIGSHLSRELLSEDNEVVCLDNFDPFYDPQIKLNNIESFNKNLNFCLERGDIRDSDFLEKVFKKYQFDQVVHLAARAGVRPSLKNPLLYEDVNIKGTLNILECLKKYQVKKLIFGSSSSVYGTNKKVPFSEDDLIQKTISPYAVTKLAGEMFCHSYSHLYNISIVCLRFFTVYGPAQRPEMAIHKFTDAIFKDKKISLYGDGSSQRDYTFISDIVAGIKASMENEFSFEIFNLGNSSTIKLKDLIATIERVSGKRAKIEWLEMQPGDVPITYASIDKSKRLLGFDPKVDITTGINIFIEWYQQNIAAGKNFLK